MYKVSSHSHRWLAFKLSALFSKSIDSSSLSLSPSQNKGLVCNTEHTQILKGEREMGSSQNCVCCHKNRHLIVSLLFILVSSLTQVRFMAEARSITKLIEAAQKGNEEEKIAMRSMIGSRPPKCERMCGSCRNCEAIQVPITAKVLAPHYKNSNQNDRATQFSAIAYSRGDDITNYKPMSWKCKCGNRIFNP